jgi:hypothetical protein
VLCVARRGLALAALAGPVAVCTFMIGFIAINAVDAGPNDAGVLAAMTTTILGLSFLLAAGIAPLALIPRTLTFNVRWSAAVAAVLAITICTAAVAITADASPLDESDLKLPLAVNDSGAAREYLNGIGAEVSDGVVQAYTAFDEVAQLLLAGDPSTASQRIQSQVVEPLTALRAKAQAEQPQSEAVAAVHADAIALIDAFITSYGKMADGLVADDPVMVMESLEEFDKSLPLFDRWMAGMDSLRAGAK